jgi:butyryl-CoA dehydrogenase
MLWELTPQQSEIIQKVKLFMEEKVKPIAKKIDKEEKIPNEIIDGLAELGVLGMAVDKKYGGLELNSWSTCQIVEEIAKVCGSTALTVCAHLGLCTMPIYWFGSTYQKEKYLPLLTKGKIFGAFGLYRT